MIDDQAIHYKIFRPKKFSLYLDRNFFLFKCFTSFFCFFVSFRYMLLNGERERKKKGVASGD